MRKLLTVLLIAIFLVLFVVAVVCVLTIFMNMEHLTDKPIPTFKGDIKNTSNTTITKPKVQNFKKSTIWNAYINYMKTGERINITDAIKAWNKDAAMKQVIVQQPNVLSVLTWNVKMWTWNPMEALKTLKKVDADVLCFQEYKDPPDYIAEYLKSTYTYSIIDIVSGFGNAIFSKKDMFLNRIKKLRDINDINELPGGYVGEQRNIIVAKVYVQLQPPIPIQIATTHLTVGEDERAVAIREYEATEILEMKFEPDVILCGDFNSGIDFDEKVHKLLTNKFEHMYDQTERNFSSTSIYGGTVDHFYYKSSYYINTNTQIIYSAGSDHFPVLFTILNASKVKHI